MVREPVASARGKAGIFFSFYQEDVIIVLINISLSLSLSMSFEKLMFKCQA